MLLSVWTEYAEYIVGVPSALIAIWFAYWVYQKQNKRKILTSNYKILSILDNDATNSVEGIKIQYNSKEVDNLYLAIIEFKNEGQIDFEGKDFEKPIKLIFRKEQEWLEPIALEVSNRIPANVDVEIFNYSPISRAIKCGMLNCGESFTVTAYLERKPDLFEIDARILGISEISPQKIENIDSSYLNRMTVFMLVLLGFGVLTTIALKSSLNDLEKSQNELRRAQHKLDILQTDVSLIKQAEEMSNIRLQRDSLAALLKAYRNK